MLRPQLMKPLETARHSSPRSRGIAHRAVLLLSAGWGVFLFGSNYRNGDSVPVDRPVEATAAAELDAISSGELRGLKQIVADLETELGRLNAASKELDAKADRLFGPEVDGTRKLKLPEDHDAFIRYLNASIGFVDDVTHSFGDLVAGDDQVDLRERVPEARKHVARIENSGIATMLARRQVRMWIEKDMQAVNALCDDWDEIEPSVRAFVESVRKYDEGGAKVEDVLKRYTALLEIADSRTLFEKSKLGVLCRQAVEGVREVERERKGGLVVN